MSEFRRRLIMQKAGKDYEIVDHILTNGLAYIDSGYFANPNTEMEMTITLYKNKNTEVNTSGTTIGNNLFYANEGDYIYLINHGGNNYEYNIYYTWTNKTYASGAPIVKAEANMGFIGAKIKLFYHSIYSHYTLHVGGKEVVAQSPTHTFTTYSLKILGGYNASANRILPYNRFDAHFYDLKITEKGEVIKHFVPAKQGNIYGMAEIIEGKFYASPNGESFDY